MEKLLTAFEVANELKVGQSTVLIYIRKGLLKAAKVGKQYLIKQSDLQEFLNEKFKV